MCVRHPDLEDVHRQFLCALAPFASYTTGRNVHPGFEFLQVALNKSGETVRRYARHCERLKLIEVTHQPDKRLATEWRICIENHAFPEAYPTLKGPHNGVDLIEEDWSTSVETIGPHATKNRSTREGVLVHTERVLGPHTDVDPSPPTSTPPPTPPSPEPAKAGVGGEEVSSSSEPSPKDRSSQPSPQKPGSPRLHQRNHATPGDERTP